MERPTICTEASQITAAHLLDLVRSIGIEALYVAPRTGWRSSILLASIVDIRAPGVAERLVEMNASGELLALGMILSRIDMPELMPGERRVLLDAGAFGHKGTRFDCLSVRGEDLLPIPDGTRCKFGPGIVRAYATGDRYRVVAEDDGSERLGVLRELLEVLPLS